MPRAVEAIQKGRAGELSPLGVIREIVSHDWLVLGEPDRPGVITHRAKVWLPVFSSPAERAAYGAIEQPATPVRGTSLFGSLSEALSGVDLDPASEHAIHYERGQFGILRAMARAVAVERVVAGEPHPDPGALLRTHPWRVGVVTGPALLLAPGTRRVALFAAADAAEANASAWGASIAAWRRLDGASLFPMLARLPLDGALVCGAGAWPLDMDRIQALAAP